MKKTTQKIAEKKVNKICIEYDYIILSEFVYIDAFKTKIHLKCNKDGYEWVSPYNSFVNLGSRCPKCSGTLKITQEQAELKVNKICNDKNYTLLEPFKYISSQKTKIHLKCNKDEHVWFVSYANLVKTTGCPKCGGRLKITQEEAENKLNNKCLEKNYTLLSLFNYINCDTKFSLICNTDNHIWNTTYYKFINQDICCPKCYGNLKTTQEEAEKLINDACFKKNCSLINPILYTNNKMRIHLRCNIDNFEWDVRYFIFINSDTGCPECGRKFKKSENKIKKLLEKNNINYIYQYRDKDIFGRKSLDFYLPDYNIAIEHQGNQHFESILFFGGDSQYNETLERDMVKYNLCKENEIDLVYFSYTVKKIPENYIDKVYIDEEELIRRIKNKLT